MCGMLVSHGEAKRLKNICWASAILHIILQWKMCAREGPARRGRGTIICQKTSPYLFESSEKCAHENFHQSQKEHCHTLNGFKYTKGEKAEKTCFYCGTLNMNRILYISTDDHSPCIDFLACPATPLECPIYGHGSKEIIGQSKMSSSIHPNERTNDCVVAKSGGVIKTIKENWRRRKIEMSRRCGRICSVRGSGRLSRHCSFFCLILFFHSLLTLDRSWDQWMNLNLNSLRCSKVNRWHFAICLRNFLIHASHCRSLMILFSTFINSFPMTLSNFLRLIDEKKGFAWAWKNNILGFFLWNIF